MSPSDLKSKLIEYLKVLSNKSEERGIMNIDGKYFSGQELVAEIESGSKLGKELLKIYRSIESKKERKRVSRRELELLKSFVAAQIEVSGIALGDYFDQRS